MMRKYIIIGVATLAATAMVAAGAGRLAPSTSMLQATDTIVPDTQTVNTPADGQDGTVVDEVVWVVGDEAILRSEIEVMRIQGEAEGVTWDGDADCRIPEQIAVQKLFLHQAALDSIEVTESEIAQGVEQRINYWIQMPQIGSKERLEEIQRKSITQIRQEMHDDYKNQMLVQRMQAKLVEDVAVSPAEVRAYFKDMPADSIPMVPTTVEVEIMTMTPKISAEEINRVKDELRNYTERVTNGETTFGTLARLYSEDPGSARQGGELGYMGRGMLDPAFASVAFNLTDPSKISKIVETEFGYHIIQLIDKRGDRINCRHILMKPKVSDEAVEQAKLRLDSVANDIKEGKFSFEDAVTFLSDDKDTRSNHGLMVNSSENERTSRFKMQDLPSEVARAVAPLEVGQMSEPFKMVNTKGKTVCAIVKLKNRIDAHRANITEDFQVLKDMVMEKRRDEIIHNWVVKKIKDTYVRMSPEYAGCNFEYEGWVK